MALDNGGSDNGLVMPVQPMGYGGYGGGYGGYPFAYPVYGNGGFGGNGLFGGDGIGYLLILFLFGAMGGWGGFGGFGGMGSMMGGANLMMWPWLMTNQTDNLVTGGFNNSGIQNQLSGIQSSVTSGFGDVQLGIAGVNQNVSNVGAGIQQSLCNGFNGINQAIASTAAQGEIAANGRHSALTAQLYNGEINALNRSFAEQTANQQGFNGVGVGLADLKYTVATENCADRTAAQQNTRDIIDAQTRGTQAILDKLCALELDGVKSQLAQAQRENVGLQNQLNMANLATSQTAQTAQILAGQTAEVDALYNRLNTCPVPCTPVYGRTPIFTCNGNNCGGNGNNGFLVG